MHTPLLTYSMYCTLTAALWVTGCGGTGTPAEDAPQGTVIASLRTGTRASSRMARTVRPEASTNLVPGPGVPPLLVPNAGQLDPKVAYAAFCGNQTLFLTEQGAVVMFRPAAQSTGRGSTRRPRTVRLEWGAGRNLEPQGIDPQPARVSSFTGNDEAGWVADLPSFRAVRYLDVAPGIDLDVAPGNGTLSLTWQVRRPESLDQVELFASIAEAGAQSIETLADGGARIHAGDTTIMFSAPRIAGGANSAGEDTVGENGSVAFQLVHGRIKMDTNNWTDILWSFSVGTTVSFSEMIGGTSDDTVTAVALEQDGSIVLAGQTWSPDFPATGGYDDSFNGMNTDAYLMKLDPTGTEVRFATFLGGSTGGSSGYVGWDMIRDVALDADGNIVVVGYTYATDYPVTEEVPQQTFGGGYTDMVVSKLSSTGDALLFSSYIGGTDNETAESVALDEQGRAVLAGYTYSTDFPTTADVFQTANRGYADAVVLRLNQQGSGFDYATLVGGSAGSSGGWGDYAKAVAVDQQGRAFVAGHTLSTDFPVTSNAAQWSLAGSYDGFLVVVAPDGRSLEYATYFGGTGMDTISGMALDRDGVAHITGATTSSDFPVTSGAVQSTFGGGSDAFLARLDPAISGPDGLTYATYLGGTGSDQARSAGVDASGGTYLTGSTSSSGFPTTDDATQTVFAGGDNDAFVALIDSDGLLAYGTYLGGAGYDNGVSLAVDPGGGAVIAGTTQSSDFAVSQAGFQGEAASTTNTDVFLVHLTEPMAPSIFLLP